MTYLLTAGQMRAIETAAIERGDVTGLELMERAGRGVLDAVFDAWPELRATSHRACILAGPGNNGGDGFVVARLLKEWGWDVEVFLFGNADKLPPDARTNHVRWTELGEVGKHTGSWSRPPDLIVDALFGTGLGRAVEDPDLLAWFRRIDDAGQGARTVAIDIPSGLDSDSGTVLGGAADQGLKAPRVMLTVSFHTPKLGHFLRQGPELCGRVVVADIGLKEDRPEGPAPARLIGGPTGDIGKATTAHKYSHGHAVILSGPSGKGGAARLAARGALRIGAGLVTVGCPPDAVQENASRLDAVMLRPVANAAALADLLKDERLNALCAGPGLGTGQPARDVVEVILSSRRGAVLDADALTGFRDRPDALFDMLHPGCVLTPHEGEFARLFPDIADQLSAPAENGPAISKADAVREAAARAGCVVLLKGPDTVVADPSGNAVVNAAHYERAAPWLATAGSGDVLAGFATGLLARGLAPRDAAATAAWLHVECARSFGPGMISEDIPEQLPRVFRALGL